MCGIYGAVLPSKFEILDAANKIRGNSASGVLYTDGKSFDFHKTEGSFNWDERKLPTNYIYLGHNQAPTSSERKFKEHNTHPFVDGDWHVGHNGVLTNFERLKTKYLPEHENIVDSSIIPALLTHFAKKNEIKTIIKVLELLEGTYGLWIFNSESANIYLARQGSTLFYDSNSFSSVKGVSYKEIKEGTLYKFNMNGAKKVGEYKVNSPFFII